LLATVAKRTESNEGTPQRDRSVRCLQIGCKRNSLGLQQHANRAADVSFLLCTVMKYYKK
jgi:hypothetical protein